MDPDILLPSEVSQVLSAGLNPLLLEERNLPGSLSEMFIFTVASL